MDKLLKPKDLDVLPTDANAASVFKYWIATFESFLQAVETGQAAIDPSVEVNRRAIRQPYFWIGIQPGSAIQNRFRIGLGFKKNPPDKIKMSTLLRSLQSNA